MDKKLCNLIDRARKTILRRDLSNEAICKLHDVGINTISKRNKRLDNFGREYQKLIHKTVAFYDPNEHIVFLNINILVKMPDSLAEEVLVHEFIHAIGNHSMKKTKHKIVLYSGLKRQIFHRGASFTRFQALNEGYVQYICNNLSKRVSDTYINEYNFVKKLINIFGEQAIDEAFMGDEENFVSLVENTLGFEKFELACRRLDNKEYKKAWEVFKKNETEKLNTLAQCELAG